MREGINDKILDKMMHYQKASFKKIGEILKGEIPFNSVPVNPQDIINSVNSLSQNDFIGLVNEFGAEKLEKFLYDVHVSEQRRQNNG